MRFSLAETMCDPAQYAPLARAAEAAGFHAYTLPDSLAYPEVSDSKYPYTPDGNRQFLEDKPFIEPFSLAPALGMVTEKLRFHTFVVKLPMRHPLIVAKQCASVAAMTHDRFSLGAGLSPWPEDYRLCGIPWEGRGKRMDEMIAILRGLMTGEYFGFEGECFQLERIKICPVPKRKLPILIGGHARASLHRAAFLGDGWMHGGGNKPEDDLNKLVPAVKELRKDSPLAHEPFEIHAISVEAYSLDGIRRLEDLGVTDLIVGFRRAYEPDSMPLEKKLKAIARYGELIDRVNG